MNKFILNSIIFSSLSLFVSAQNCAAAAVCFKDQRAAIQSNCGAVSQNQACLCQGYQGIISQCFSGCTDSNSMSMLSSLQNEEMSFCNSAATQIANMAQISGLPYNGNFLASNPMGSTLIVNNGPTGMAIPIQTGGFGNQATISMAYTPLKISGASSISPNFFASTFFIASLALYNLN